MPLSFGRRYLYCAFTRKLAILSSSFCVYGVILSLLRRAVKMALERHSCQTICYVPLASLPSGKLERTVRCPCICTAQFPQAALDLKLPDLCGQPLDAVLVLPRKVVDFLHGVVGLLHTGAHLVQAARADGKIVFYRLKTLGRPPPVFADRQKQARLKHRENLQDAPTTRF